MTATKTTKKIDYCSPSFFFVFFVLFLKKLCSLCTRPTKEQVESAGCQLPFLSTFSNGIDTVTFYLTYPVPFYFNLATCVLVCSLL